MPAFLETAQDEYAERVEAIRSWMRDVAHETGNSDVHIEVDARMQRLIRTHHIVELRRGARAESVALTQEEFRDEFGLFERSAAPKLRAALRRVSGG